MPRPSEALASANWSPTRCAAATAAVIDASASGRSPDGELRLAEAAQQVGLADEVADGAHQRQRRRERVAGGFGAVLPDVGVAEPEQRLRLAAPVADVLERAERVAQQRLRLGERPFFQLDLGQPDPGVRLGGPVAGLF